MAFFSLLYVAIILLIIYIKLKFFISKAKKLLLNIPGPEPYLLFGNLLRFKVDREDLYQTILDVCKEYSESPLVRVFIGQKPRIFLTKAEAAEKLLSSTNEIIKGGTYKLASDWLGDGLLLSSGSKWLKRRRMVTPTFHFRILDQFREIMNEQSEVLTSKIAENNSQWFNVYPYLTRCTLDVLAESSMGVKLRCQQGNAEEYLNAIIGMGDIFMQRVFNIRLRSDFLFKLSKEGKLQQKYLNLVHGFTRKVINDRKVVRKLDKEQKANAKREEDVYGIKRRLAFLDMLLEAQEEENTIDDEGIKEEVDMFLFAGHDTTASAATWAIWNIARFPHIQENIVKELEDVLGVDPVTHISMEEIQQLKYLECVIKESMRMFPSVPLTSRSLHQNFTICGYEIPAGSDVGFVTQLIHNDPKHWPNPETFDPERFFPENAVNRHPYAYIPFSAGSRNCVGQRFAMMELKCIVSHMVHKYHLKTKTKLGEMKLLGEFILRPSTGIWLQIESRKRDY